MINEYKARVNKIPKIEQEKREMEDLIKHLEQERNTFMPFK